MRTSVPAKAKLTVLHSDLLQRFPWLIHGYSTRQGGCSHAYGGNALNLGFTPHDGRASVRDNRTAFLAKLGAGELSLVTLRQIHSDIIHLVTEAPAESLVGDGLVSNSPGLLLAVQTADCLPVTVVDPRKRAVGVFHAGWRGTVRRIVEKGVGAMRRFFDSRPRDLEVAIGPGVGACCYTVGAEVRDSFYSQFDYAERLFREVEESDPVREKYPMLFLTARAPGHSKLPVRIFLDLVEANRGQLLATGVRSEKIDASPLCTSCNTGLLFSHRAENGVTGRMMGVAGIRPGESGR